ncbi:MAG: hypothetical protein R3C44_21330 [Chloroflexota bacterium]
MNNFDDPLDTYFQTALQDYPQAQLPADFQANVLMNIHEASAHTRLSLVPQRLTISGLAELAGAALLGTLLATILLIGLWLGGLIPAGWLGTPLLPLSDLSLVWVVPALGALALELVLVILAGMQLIEN